MKLTLDEHEVIEINGDRNNDESVIDIEKSKNFEIHINKKFRDIVTIDYFEETPIDENAKK